jgi:hypothetical protein
VIPTHWKPSSMLSANSKLKSLHELEFYALFDVGTPPQAVQNIWLRPRRNASANLWGSIKRVVRLGMPC